MFAYLKRRQKLLLKISLGIFACFVAIAMTPQLQWANSRANAVDAQRMNARVSMSLFEQQATDTGMALENRFSKNLTSKEFTATLSGNTVAPNPVSTQATGEVQASLRGNRLVVRGVFRGLSSPLRDYVADPLNPPNPKVTSAVHLHRGMPTENGPFQYALQVKLDSDGLGGTVKGKYILTDEQLEALKNGQLYVDLHTKNFRAGELRGILTA
jgi:CHRD domain